MPATTSRQKLRDIFVPIVATWEVFEATKEEASSEVDGVHVIGRAVGPFAVMDGDSLNGRRYSTVLWERQFKELKPRFDKGGLFGTCGHERELDEDSVVAGTITHKTSKIWPDYKNKIVMGEMYILGTDGGRNLYTLMKAGMPLGVSSRAYGTTSQSESHDGVPEVDPETYLLEAWDVVINPGIHFARPTLLESEQSENSDLGVLNAAPSKTNEDQKMTIDVDKLFERQSNELVDAKTNLSEAANKVVALQAKLTESENTVKWFSSKLGGNSRAVANTKLIVEGVRKWMQLEPFASMARQTGMFDRDGVDLGDMFKSIGATNEAVSKATKGMSPKKIAEELAELAEYRKLGNRKLIGEGIALLRQFLVVSEGRRPDRLKKVLENASRALKNHKSAELQVAANRLAESYKKAGVVVDTKVVRNMLSRADEATVITELNALFSNGAQVTNEKFDKNFAPRYRKISEQDRGKKPLVRVMPKIMEQAETQRQSQNELMGGGERSEAKGARDLFESIKISTEPVVPHPGQNG